jgi:hypothetical protein
MSTKITPIDQNQPSVVMEAIRHAQVTVGAGADLPVEDIVYALGPAILRICDHG